MKGITRGFLACALVFGFCFAPMATALPKDTQIVRIPAQPWANNLLRNGVRPIEDAKYNMGYVNAAGKVVVPLEYSLAEEFFEGRGIVARNNKRGAVDATGKTVIPLIYDYLDSFSHGLSVAGMNGRFGIINKGGTIVVPFAYSEIRLPDFNASAETPSLDTLIRVGREIEQKDRKVRKYGYVNLRGNVIVPVEYEELDAFFEGLAWFKRGKKCGYMDARGVVRIEAIYDEAKAFREGLAAVRKGTKWGFIDQTGKTVIPFEYDDVPPEHYGVQAGFVDGIAVVAKDTGLPELCKWGYIDRTGRALTPFIYYTTESVSEGYIAASTYDNSIRKSTLLDRQGRTVVPLTEDYIGSMHNGRARIVGEQEIGKDVRKKYGNDIQNGIGYLDGTGKVVIPMKYTDTSDFIGWDTVPEYARVSNSFVSLTGQMYNPRYWTIDRDGKTVKPYGFESISAFHDGVAYAYDGSGQSVIAFIVDKSWKEPLPIPSTQVVTFPASKMAVKVAGKSVELAAYRLGDNWYCRPRDLALALDGSPFSFDLSWNAGKKTWNLLSKKSYTKIGGELSPGDGRAKPATLSVSAFALDGKPLENIVAVSIAGADYVDIEGILSLLKIPASRNGSTVTVGVDADSASATKPAPASPKPGVIVSPSAFFQVGKTLNWKTGATGGQYGTVTVTEMKGSTFKLDQANARNARAGVTKLDGEIKGGKIYIYNRRWNETWEGELSDGLVTGKINGSLGFEISEQAAP